MNVREGHNISIPLEMAEVWWEVEARRARDRSIAHHAHVTREHILVVDDDPHLRFMTCEFLSELGYDFSEAENVPTALAMMQSNPTLYTCVLMDIHFNGRVSGLDVNAILAMHRPIDSPVPEVIAMTGDPKFCDPEKVAQFGFVDVLPKPFDMKLLQAVLLTHLGDPEAA